jgi:hypothetical protein
MAGGTSPRAIRFAAVPWTGSPAGVANVGILPPKNGQPRRRAGRRRLRSLAATLTPHAYHLGEST